MVEEVEKGTNERKKEQKKQGIIVASPHLALHVKTKKNTDSDLKLAELNSSKLRKVVNSAIM